MHAILPLHRGNDLRPATTFLAGGPTDAQSRISIRKRGDVCLEGNRTVVEQRTAVGSYGGGVAKCGLDVGFLDSDNEIGAGEEGGLAHDRREDFNLWGWASLFPHVSPGRCRDGTRWMH